ncbi:NAD(P)/FAD-dependent oxidoreductase [Dehalobacterium formicoaceticum]|uniref:FAD-dependent protein C-terminal domain-containing protein n=1 Tax=Dehalobacterium formicoaceticum TaxID=51515 RepID=A0ABT1Y0I5_9FIRM|nr:hypothetical protein [Dehalobacterium formicoaceticum]MCR6544377.1 hypothetical protein [Dehalobacterium formicoaceticum]
MKLRLTNLRLDLNMNEEALATLAARKIRVAPGKITSLHIIKKALDARKNERVEFVYSVDIQVGDIKGIKMNPPFVQPAPEPFREQLKRGDALLSFPPLVVGSGPAGLFCALKLAAWGYRPLVLERGFDVDRRFQEIERFWQTGVLNPDCNVQFGEGGAGTFSDGKLTTRVKDPRVRSILEQLAEAGAPEEILYLNKPHIGTDVLRGVMKNLRRKLISLGGQVIFGCRVTGLKLSPEGSLAGLEVGQGEIPASVGVFAIGHSARDTYQMLFDQGVLMEAKPFAMGLRVEHPQSFIDQNQYGKNAGHPKLGAADYALSFRDKERGRSAYSFCMCPGGVVVGAASETGGVVTNGMSEHARASGRANAAIVATVDIPDFGDGCLKGMEFQRKWEQIASYRGGGNYYAPAQKLEDFLQNRPSADLAGTIGSSYRPGVTPGNLRDCLPQEVGETIAAAIRHWDRQIKGFIHPQAVVTGVETRTSAPVRILRNERLVSMNTPGLYPAGEGAGYAGGIISAAVDGLKAAEAIISHYEKPKEFFPSALIDKLTSRRD